jgi:hypothetical protein
VSRLSGCRFCKGRTGPATKHNRMCCRDRTWPVLNWLRGCQITWLPGCRVTGLRGCQITWLPGCRVTALPGYRVTGLPDYMVTGLPGYRVAGLSGYRVTGLCVEGTGFLSANVSALSALFSGYWSMLQEFPNHKLFKFYEHKHQHTCSQRIQPVNAFYWCCIKEGVHKRKVNE